MIFCFIILFSVLSVLSCFNFAFDILDQIEADKAILGIDKPQDICNSEFLAQIDDAVKSIDADIMLRQVENANGKDLYQYFKTNHTKHFIEIGTTVKNQPLHVSLPMQDLSFYPWADAEQLDLSTVTYYVTAEQQSAVAETIAALGYSVTITPTTYISSKFPVLLFSFVPAFMLIISMVFYTLSNSKKNVLKKMEGYKTFDIMLDEVKHIGPIFLVGFFIIGTITVIAAAILYHAALPQYLLFSLSHIALLIVVALIGFTLSSFLVCRQKNAEHLKGRVPKHGIYMTTILTKGVFIGFIIFFLSIAIRNASIAHHTMQTFQFFSDKLDGYATVPVSNSSASIENMAENYKKFYSSTVNRYNGILVDSSNYTYDLISGKTLAEEFGQTEITVNQNYLNFNPIYTVDGHRITDAQLSDTAFNILIPASKEQDQNIWRETILTLYGMETNFISYDGDASKIYSYNADTGTGACGALDEPIILIMEEEQIEGAYIFSCCTQGAYFLDISSENAYAELQPILQESGLASIASNFPSVAETFLKAIHQQKRMLILYGTQSVILLMGLTCLIVFGVQLYCENYKSKIACCLIEGYSLLHCIQKHLIITVICYMIVILGLRSITAAMQLSLNDPLLLAIFIAEFILTFVVSLGYSKRNLYQIMKGAE